MKENNILFITTFPSFNDGGTENYLRSLYESFREINFYEFPIWWHNSIRDKKNNYENVQLYDNFSNFDSVIFDKISIPKFLYNLKNKYMSILFKKILNQRINQRKVANFLKKEIKKNNISKIVIHTNLFYNKNFYKKYKNIIYFVQHMIIDKYIDTFKRENNEFKKENFFLKTFNNISYKRPPFFRNIRNLICFDNINKKIVSNFFDIKNIECISLPSNFEIYNSSQDTKKYDFLYYGRLEKEKGIDKILQFAKQNKKYSFLFIGDGSYFDEINLPNCKKIKWLNEKNKLVKKIRESKYFLLFSESEGSSFSLIESMSQSVPGIVLNTFDSSKFIIGSDQRGLLLDIIDFEKINEYINKNDYDSTCNNCFEFSKENFSKDIFLKKWDDIFNK